MASPAPQPITVAAPQPATLEITPEPIAMSQSAPAKGPAASVASDGASEKSAQAENDYYAAHGLVLPTPEQKATLKRVSGRMPMTCYLLCAVEFSERASYYGCMQVYKNFIRAPLPPGGNGSGASGAGSQYTAGALGMGSAVANAMTELFKFMSYALPIFFGWLADVKTGRYKMICWGVAICGVAHVIMIISALPPVLMSGKALGPFAFSLYLLAVGAAQFKPNISPTVMDQSPHKVEHVIVNDKGEEVIVDPSESINHVMHYFYLLINIGSCTGVATTYLAKLVGYWAAYLIPTILYLMLPPLLWYLNPRLVKQPAGGSKLGDVFRVLGDGFRHGGLRSNSAFWEAAKPSVRMAAAVSPAKPYAYGDDFVTDVRRTMQACGIFLFLPIFSINNGGLGAAGNALTAGMQSHGLPNDLLDNMNALSIVIMVPIMNSLVYPWLLRRGIRWGSIARMTFGFTMCTIGSSGFAILQHFVYKTSPCGNRATTCAEIVPYGENALSDVHIGWYALPIIVTAISEIFVNIPAYGLAYSRSPKHMKGLVVSIELFMTAVAAMIALATTPAIVDPYLTWAFAGPTMVGAVMTVLFWWLFHHIDQEEFYINTGFGDMQTDAARKGKVEAGSAMAKD